MKLLFIIVLGLLLISTIVYSVYDFNTYRRIKRNFYKIIGKDCELIYYPNIDATQIENCAMYQYKPQGELG